MFDAFVDRREDIDLLLREVDGAEDAIESVFAVAMRFADRAVTQGAFASAVFIDESDGVEFAMIKGREFVERAPSRDLFRFPESFARAGDLAIRLAFVRERLIEREKRSRELQRRGVVLALEGRR